MASWTTVSSTVLEVGKPIRSIDITAIKENITAVMEKAAGAPQLATDYVVTAMIAALQVTEAKLGNSSVAQAKLKTTTASGNVVVVAGSGNNYSLTGGTYSWWTASAGGTGSQTMFGNGDSGAGVLGLSNPSVDNSTFFVDERYIQASPPYNLGHGDIPLFVVALMAGNGSLRSVSVAPDPTWAYHGPTDIRPHFFDSEGRAFRLEATYGGLMIRQLVLDRGLLARFMSGEFEAELAPVEITPEFKNRDMDLFPHPWVGNDLAGLTAVLLDPLSPAVDRLARIHGEAGAGAVRKIIEEGYLEIGNDALAVRAPSRLRPVAVRWK